MGLRPRPGTNSVCRWPKSVGEDFVGCQRLPHGSPETGAPSKGLTQELKQHLCSRGGWVAVVGDSCGQEPKNWQCGPESLTVLEARLTHKSAQ